MDSFLRKTAERAKPLAKRIVPQRLLERIYAAYRKLRGNVRARKRSRQTTLTLNDLVADLRQGGISSGEVIVVHSSLSRIGNVSDAAVTVVKALMEAVSPAGTILMPCYSSSEKVIRDFREGKLVDLRTAASGTGMVTETLRDWPGSLRSSHPFSSVAAWGKYAEHVTAGHQDDPRICHRASPLAQLLELDGKIVGLGVSLGPVSFYHVVEDTWDGFPLQLYQEAVELSYIDADGWTVTREVQQFDPEKSMNRIDKPGGIWIRDMLTLHLERRGILRYFTCGQARSWIMEARPLYDELKRLAAGGVTIYLTKAQWERMDRRIDFG